VDAGGGGVGSSADPIACRKKTGSGGNAVLLSSVEYTGGHTCSTFSGVRRGRITRNIRMLYNKKKYVRNDT